MTAGDKFDAKKRSWIMSQIKGRNTMPELLVFTHLRKEGIYFQKHYRVRRLGIVLDIALPRKKKAIFIDGDFWHGRNHERLLKTRPENDYWILKIRRNMERDKEQEALLASTGWKILRVWSSDIMRKRTREEEMAKIIDFMR